MLLQPLRGWRCVTPAGRRTARDFAEALRRAEALCPEAEGRVRVADNLNTRARLYEAFDPARARRIAERLEWHDPPTHGSWLNMAEIEFAALTKPCLDRRIGSMARRKREVAAWEEDRNERVVGVNRRFTTADARVKPRSLYPANQE